MNFKLARFLKDTELVSKLRIGFYQFQIVADISSIYPNDKEAPPAGVDDMTKLSYLHEPGVLQNLASRFALNEIYVSHIYATNSGHAKP